MRKHPKLSLERSPLVLALAQVRFAPVLKMESYIPDIQEELRRHGFPAYKQAILTRITIGPEGPKAAPLVRWVFSSRDNRECVTLSETFVAVESSAYRDFEDFSVKLRVALDVVGKTTNVDFSERIGLRYVNLIRASGSQGAAHFLHRSLVGIPESELGTTEQYSTLESRSTSAVGTLVVRIRQAPGGTFLPPDLANDDISFDVETESDEKVTLLDIDHFSEQRRDFDVDALVKEAWALHEDIGHTFRAATTPEGRAEWGEKTE